MAEWGFNFARLPCSYWVWSDKNNWMRIDDAALQPLDIAIALGRQYGIHIDLCLHRIPGYCVNGRELEPFQLFDSPRTLWSERWKPRSITGVILRGVTKTYRAAN